ncbi:XRE family transcriptional regulator [Brevibacillus invocatus]|uniref:XRE family transcriptional regulator n=1 Tax=Brevibacillus invocatus TaxID=173959 RepID=A0A3M8C2V1_9BACL|nr:helix-turn-helix transcriptional regulator [Brevibacillus invocatus]RNB69974.1 XRE family transcriptional regulator [Brevibacillus invocatus]
MFGLGKKRSRLGKWLDSNDLTQGWLCSESKLNKATISRLCASDDNMPNLKTIQKILKALRKVDPNVKQDDFWMM